jgi:hypothetical protein
MKKLHVKKLVLNRETITKLDEERLEGAKGGFTVTCYSLTNTYCSVCERCRQEY